MTGSQRLDGIVARLRASLVRTGVSPRELFARLDTDQVGSLNPEQLRKLLVHFEPDLTSVECQSIFQIVDKSCSGYINFNDFCMFLQGNSAISQQADYRGGLSRFVESQTYRPTPQSPAIIQRIALTIERAGIDPGSLFSRLDINVDGRLSTHEFERLILQLYPQLSALERDAIFQHFDLDKSGDVDMREFSQALACATLDAASCGAVDQVEDLAGSESTRVASLIARLRSSIARTGLGAYDLFKRLDLNMDGRIDVVDLEKLATQLQPDLTTAERQLFFQSIDLDGSGDVDLEEFCAIFESTGSPRRGHSRSNMRSTSRPHRGRTNDVILRGVRVR